MFWYFPHALSSGVWNLFHTPLQFYPDGISLVFTSNSAIGSILMAPLSLLISPAAALNVWLLLHLWLGGWFFFRFCKILGAGVTGAFLGGIAFMCSPFVSVHLPGHYTLVQIGFSAGALYSLAELARRCALGGSCGGRSYLAPSIALGLCTWAVGATDFYLAIMTITLLLPVAMVHLSLQYGKQLLCSSTFWKGFFLAVTIAIVMLLPWACLVVLAMEGHRYSHDFPTGYSSLVGRWSRLVTLPQYNPIWAAFIYEGSESRISVFNEYTYLGVAALFIAFTGLLCSPRWRLMLVWAFAFIVALGLSGSNGLTQQPEWEGTPLAFGKWWPLLFPFSEFRVPGRWLFALCTVLAVGVALGSDALLARMRSVWRTPAALLLFTVMAVDLVRFPLPIFDVQPLPTFLPAASNSGSGTALDVPVGILSGQGHSLGQYNKETLLRQMNHGMPVLTAYVSRLPADIIAKRKKDLELSAFLAAQDADGETTLPANLDWAGFRTRYNITAVRIPLDWPTSPTLQKIAVQINANWHWKNEQNALIGYQQNFLD